MIYLSLKTSHARMQTYAFNSSKRKHETNRENRVFGQLNSETGLKLRHWVVPSVPASVGVWGKLFDTRWHGQKQHDWHRFSLVYFLPLLLHFRCSSHGEVFIVTWHLINSGNTDMVNSYQEIHHSGLSGWTDRGASVDKLWTRLRTDAHTWETTATYVHAHIPKSVVMNIPAHSWWCAEEFETWQAAGKDRGQSADTHEQQSQKEKTKPIVSWT